MRTVWEWLAHGRYSQVGITFAGACAFWYVGLDWHAGVLIPATSLSITTGLMIAREWGHFDA